VKITTHNKTTDREGSASAPAYGGYHLPYIDLETHTWWQWDDEQKAYVDTEITPYGPKGDPGEQGERGPQGLQGEQGTGVYVTGVDETIVDGGMNVVNFSDGTSLRVRNGNTGARGFTGEKGDKGDKGEKGDRGDAGIVDQEMSDTSSNAVRNSAIKAYIDSQIATAISSLFDYKGEKLSLQAIQQITTAKKGDVWKIADTGEEYYATESITSAKASAWQPMGVLVDLSGYVLHSALGALAYKDYATGTFTPEGTISIGDSTPSGSVSAPTITVTPATDMVAGTLPEFEAYVDEDHGLNFSFNAGTEKTVLTGVSASASQPTFTGTSERLTGSFTGTQGNISVS